MNLSLLPHIFAALVTASFNFLLGIGVLHTAILLPYFTPNNNVTREKSFVLSDRERTWLLSAPALVLPISAALSGITMDNFGRLNALRLAAVPYAVSWIITATSQSFAALLVGKCLSSSSYGWFVNGASVYIAEISPPNVRGMLLHIKVAFMGSGTLTALAIGSKLHWRTAAWINLGLTPIPVILSAFLHESPLWLVTKGRSLEARTALHAFHKHKTFNIDRCDAIEMKLSAIQELHERQNFTALKMWEKMKFFLDPNGYKRVLMVAGLRFFQDFSGTSFIFGNIVQFLMDFGTTYDSYQIGVYIGIAKLITSVCMIWVMKKLSRRILMMISCAGMSACMLTLGIYAGYSIEDRTNYQLIPLLATSLYSIVAITGMFVVPYMISAEAYPTQVRGVGQSIYSIFGCITEFSSIQCYYLLQNIVHASYPFYYISLICLLGCVYIYVFVIETHRKTFAEIESHFSNDLSKPASFKGGRQELNCKGNDVPLL
ncbi:facilitated trehalose transporter Tret1-like [Photinus pyralis]|uniref:facilitated trehalose transporter Tret1-like n=1 Tax=Photinus pyralis TaxID=7054 RepID=UPI0012672C27|nr:facilitated trehalose transporter Tret1-like [Photinus pyralis]XP_031346327.1 facilitated trehalose transporter Tret1-like [Photinus pyralis]XP_031347809.1 facilitated trehalose transporter Tret1-like [Photinus pyralis]XP_031347810.1 facilitated trehalose transporter Tret1-like [Photinus pyralis]